MANTLLAALESESEDGKLLFQTHRQNPDAIIVELRLLRLNNENTRKKFGREELEELASSIKQEGVLQPIIAVPIEEVINGEQYYRVVAGDRRFMAAEIAGLFEVPIIVRRGLAKLDRLRINLTENEHREGFLAAEYAEGLAEYVAIRQQELDDYLGDLEGWKPNQRLTSKQAATLLQEYQDLPGWIKEIVERADRGRKVPTYTAEDAAKEIKKKPRQAANYLQIAGAHPAVRDMNRENQLDYGQMLEVSRIPAGDGPKFVRAQLAVAREVADEGLDEKGARGLVNRTLKKLGVARGGRAASVNGRMGGRGISDRGMNGNGALGAPPAVDPVGEWLRPGGSMVARAVRELEGKTLSVPLRKELRVEVELLEGHAAKLRNMLK